MCDPWVVRVDQLEIEILQRLSAVVVDQRDVKVAIARTVSGSAPEYLDTLEIFVVTDRPGNAQVGR